MWRCTNCGAKNINDSEKTCPCCGMLHVEQPQQKPNEVVNYQSKKGDYGNDKERVIEAILKLNADFGGFALSGTGFIIEGDYIVTNAHVVTRQIKNQEIEVAKNILASFDKTIRQKIFQLKLLDYNAAEDVAILKAINFSDFTYRLKLGDSLKVKRADKVFTIGCPLDFDFSYLEGVVSAPSRKDNLFNEVIQTNLPINHGNSGGPLCNERCEVIGITTFTKKALNLDTEVMSEGARTTLPIFKTIDGMSFCVTSEAIKQLLSKVKMKGR